MAALEVSSDLLLSVLREHSVPYSWPDRTCFGPVMTLIREGGPAPNRPPWLLMEEKRGLAVMGRDHGSWDGAFDWWAKEHGYVRRVLDEHRRGDILAFRSPLAEAVRGKWPGSWPFIGIMGRGGFIYTKGEGQMVPFPADRCKIERAWRVICRL